MEVSAQNFCDMIISAANNLENNKQAINDLNVFPVPDGDTGTNMSLTLNSAIPHLKIDGQTGIGDLSHTVANALIRGARGNSGVILSLIFRGFAKGLKGLDTADGKAIASAALSGVDAAYKAVMKPTEGTILTVARLSAAAAAKSAEAGGDAENIFTVMVAAANETLSKTPDMLPVLKQAGVVDAGGKGLVLVYEGFLSVIKDGVMIEAKGGAKTAERADFESFSSEDIHFAYCTEFIVDKTNINQPADGLREFLNTIGDCVVVVDAGDFIKTHVHTNNPGKALESAIALGTLSKIKIENMREQHTALFEDTQPAEEKLKSVPIEKDFGFVSVAAGEGFEAVFKDLGVDRMIRGGQTMNPSTEDILKEINLTPASTVFVLPNNKNIIMAAQQCIGLAEGEREIIVLPTKTIPQGITALLAFDPTATSAENTAAMTETATTVKTLSVTYAARDSVFDGLTIKKGQYLGLIETKVDQVSENLKDCVSQMVASAITGSESFVNIFYGENATLKQAESVKKILAARLGEGAEINIVNGGQPVYYFIISIE